MIRRPPRSTLDRSSAASDVYKRQSLFGAVPIKILERLEGKFSLSPDDSRIAFIRVSTNSNGQQEHALMIANSDGTNESKLLARQYPDKLDAPVWSPDGESIVCA